MADDEQFSLCWNNFNSNLSAGFHESLCRGDLVDVTLAAEGQFVKAHRLVLSVCSPYFRKMFTQMPAHQHAFVFLKDVSHSALKDLIQFMYCGEVNVKQEALPAFISTAEALQIKGLTDSDPPPPPSPAKPSTPAPQPIPAQQPQQIVSPRVRQRTSTSRSYKVESIDDSDDNKQSTQIVIQSSTAPQQAQQNTIVQHHHQSQQQQSQQIHHQPQQQHHHQQNTTTVVSQKRPAAQRSLSTPHTKRVKSTVDPLEANEAGTQQIVQSVVAESKSQNEEFIDLPIELPTKSEPEYADDTGEVEAAEQDTTYVEDDSYGNIGYDESYFTENEEAANTTNVSGVAATSSKAIVKQQSSFSDSNYVDTADQSANEAQETGLLFIESPWSTPCLVLNNFMYNCHSRKNNKEYWRCHNYSKRQQSERCRSRCVLENGRLKSCTGGHHNHLPHTEKIGRMLQRNRMISEGVHSSSLKNVSKSSTFRQRISHHEETPYISQYNSLCNQFKDEPLPNQVFESSSIMLMNE